MTNPLKGGAPIPLIHVTEVSSGTNIVFDTSALTPMYTSHVRPTSIQIVGAGAVGSSFVRTAKGFSRGVHMSWQVPHHGPSGKFVFYDHEGKLMEGQSQEYQLFVSTEDAETHADLGIMRKQFLEDLAERGLTEQEYLERVANPYAPHAPEAPKPEVVHGERMLEFSTVLFSRRARELVVEPIIADYKKDMQEALANGAGKWKLRVIQARYWIAYVVGFLDEVLPAIGRLWRALSGS